VRLHELAAVTAEVVDLTALKIANIVSGSVKHAKVIASGNLEKPVTVQGLAVTKGARAAIEAAGGKIKE
jgi:large subunit ribosomal protein L15